MELTELRAQANALAEQLTVAATALESNRGPQPDTPESRYHRRIANIDHLQGTSGWLGDAFSSAF